MKNKGSNLLVKNMCINAIIAAMYYVLVILFGDLSFGFSNGILSIRIAEILVPLVFIDKKFVPGLVIGCFLANLFPLTSASNVVDVIVGPIQSLITCLILIYVRPRQLATILGAAFCGLTIGLELFFLGFSVIGLWIILTTFISELIVFETGFLLINKINLKIF